MDKSIRHNTASSYFNVFLGMVRLAYKDNIISEDYTKDVKPIKWNHNTRKEYLTMKEVEMLEQVKYDKYPDIPRASLFSIHTGLRRSDILDLKWEHLSSVETASILKRLLPKQECSFAFHCRETHCVSSASGKKKEPCLPN